MISRTPPLISLFLPLVFPLSLQAAIVLEVPVPKANIGGAGGAGAALTTPNTALNTPGGLGIPTLDGGRLPSVGGINTQLNAPKDMAINAAGQKLKTAPAELKIGSAQFQRGLKTVQDGTGRIKAEKKGGSEKSAAVSHKLFDGGDLREGKTGGVTALESGIAPSGFGGGAANGGGQRSFARSLMGYGVGRVPLTRLLNIMKVTHPGSQKNIYHNASHSVRVPNTLAAIIDSPAGAALKLTPAEKALLLVAGALHDIDPQRAPNTPARVTATLRNIDKDPDIGALLAQLGLGERGRGQLKTLIKFTDFSLNKDEMAKMQNEAEAMARTHFGADLAPKWIALGRLLAYTDQTAMYLDTGDFAERAVRGLANELRTAAKSENPTDEMILDGTAGFLKPLMDNAHFALLPSDLQANFRDVYRRFAARKGVPSPGAQKDGRSRAPPAMNPADDPLLVGHVEHRGPGHTEGYYFAGRPLEYFDGSGSKMLFVHPNFPNYLLTIFPKKSPKNFKYLTKAQQAAEISEATAVSRLTRKGELDGRKLLLPHKMTAPMPLSAGRMLLRDQNGIEWNTSYLVQERVRGKTLRNVSSADLELVKSLFAKLVKLRIKVPEDVHIADNIMIGHTDSDPATRAYVIDAEGTTYAGPQKLLDRLLDKPDPLQQHYKELLAQIRRDIYTGAGR
ncbi:MAG: HD domain-containing protein [Elusimicrobiota bacterium]